MPYEINDTPIPGLREHRKPRGIKPAYPFRDMAVGQWIAVPLAEEYRLGRAVKNAKYKHGIRVQVQQSADGQWWIAIRAPDVMR